MSGAARKWAKGLRLSSKQKLLLLILADHAGGDDDSCQVSVDTLALEACVSDRTVQRAISDLVAAGLVVAQREGGRSVASTFRCLVGAKQSDEAVNTVTKSTGTFRERVTNLLQKGDKTAADALPENPFPVGVLLPSYVPEEEEREKESKQVAHASTPAHAPPRGATLVLVAGTDLLGDPIGGKPPILVNNRAAAFERFWAAYPPRLAANGKMSKDGKLFAKEEFAKAIRSVDAAVIIDRVQKYNFDFADPRWIKEPGKWLQEGRYLAEITDADPRLLAGKPRPLSQREQLMAECGLDESLDHLVSQNGD